MTEGVPTLSRDGDLPAVRRPRTRSHDRLCERGAAAARSPWTTSMPVLRDVELEPDVIDRCRPRIRAEGIAFDGGERDLATTAAGASTTATDAGRRARRRTPAGVAADGRRRRPRSATEAAPPVSGPDR